MSFDLQAKLFQMLIKKIVINTDMVLFFAVMLKDNVSDIESNALHF